MKKYNTNELIGRLTFNTSLNKEETKMIVTRFLYELHDVLAEGNEVTLIHVGRLTPVENKRNKGKTRLRFRPSVQLNKDMNEED